MLSYPDPGAIGAGIDPACTAASVATGSTASWKIPARSHPGTPMPAIFPRGKPATLPTVLDGDPVRQKEALWAISRWARMHPVPKPPPPLADRRPLRRRSSVGRADSHASAGPAASSRACAPYTATHDLLIYDLGTCAPHSFFSGAQILRDVQGRLRRLHRRRHTARHRLRHRAAFPADGRRSNRKSRRTDRCTATTACPTAFASAGGPNSSPGRWRWRKRLRIVRDGATRRLLRECPIDRCSAGRRVEVRCGQVRHRLSMCFQ